MLPKYRAWIIAENRYREIATIEYDRNKTIDGVWCYGDNISDMPLSFTPEQVILEQWTGLLDKNGTEIYEGDRVDVLDRDWVDALKDTKRLNVVYVNDSYILASDFSINELKKDINERDNWDKRNYITALYKPFGRDLLLVVGTIHDEVKDGQDNR